MYSNNTSRAASAGGFMALFAIMLVMGLELMASPAEGAPFAYVTNHDSRTVSVIDTATNTVVATVPVGISPQESPSPRTGNTPMSRMMPTAPFR